MSAFNVLHAWLIAKLLYAFLLGQIVMPAGGSLLLAIDDNNLVSAIIIVVETNMRQGVLVKFVNP
jgi:hypothetical protein